MAGGKTDTALMARDLSFDFEAPELGGVATPRHAQLPQVPALDGLRGLAVAVVVLYHLDLGWAPGGFLGVSLFFTLSGFLITSVLLIEHDMHDRIDFRAFWGRRFRRLLPAAWAGIVLSVVFAYAAGDPDQVRRLPGDVIGALGQVANWRFIFVADTYTSSYQAPSPLLHYWSLAIEEQFYVVFPVVVAVLVGRRVSMRIWALTVAGLLAASAFATYRLFDPLNPSAVYFNTGTRVAEIVAGVGLALAVRGWWLVRPRRRTGKWLGRSNAFPALCRTVIPVLALMAAIVLWAVTTTEDLWLYQGGFFVVALLSCAMVAGVITDGPLSRLVGAKVLRQLGVVSYGIYVYHWPLFIWLSPERTQLSGAALVAARLAATMAVAGLSYRFLERPIRRGTLRLSLTLAWGPALLAAAVIVASIAVSNEADDRAVTTAETAAAAAPIVTQPPVTSPVPTTLPETPKLAPPAKVLMLGDSLVHQASPIISATLAEQGTETRVIGGEQQTLLRRQARWLQELEETLVSYQPDVVVLESCCGHYDSRDPFVENGQRLAVDSPELWAAFERTAEQAILLAQKHAKAVLWTLVPPASTNGFYGPIEGRIGTANAIVLRLAERHPQLGLVDWRVISGPSGEYVEELPDAEGNSVPVRAKDGFHFAPAGMAILAGITRDAIERSWQATAKPSGPTQR